MISFDVSNDCRNGLISDMTVVAQLRLEPGVDEVMELPKLPQINIGPGVHHVETSGHLNPHMRVVVPVLNVGGEAPQRRRISLRYGNIDVVGCAEVIELHHCKRSDTPELRWSSDGFELLNDLPVKQEKAVADREAVPSDMNRAETVEKRCSPGSSDRELHGVVFERLQLCF